MRENQDSYPKLHIRPEEYSRSRQRVLGNHHIYAKVSPNLKWNDRRLEFLKPDYFCNKVVLDIGCNEGILTIPIAIKFQPKMIRGVDIDPQMIRNLHKNKQKFIQKNRRYQLPKQYIQEITELPQYFREKLEGKFGGTVIVTQIDHKYQILPQGTHETHLFPNNIDAQVENVFSLDRTTDYECIMCMGVTRWLHLAYGDEAIKELFKLVNSLLQEGGIFILEAQPWSSYRKKKNLFKCYSEHYKMIVHKPERFGEMLKKMGMQQIQLISCSRQNELKYDIVVFQKKGFYSQ